MEPTLEALKSENLKLKFENDSQILTAPNYRVVEQQKYYNDYLIEYGIKPINNCPPEIAWQPNCQ